MTRLTHLQRLEAESIHILREVVAECERPVMLYSIGKDSSVMLHLAMKAFYPAKPPFPLLHVDTTWKFREMIAFRDAIAAAARRSQLLVHINQDGLARGIGPFTHGSAVHTDVMKTQGAEAGARQVRLRRGVRRRAARRGEVARQGARRSRSARRSIAGTRSASVPSSGGCTTRARTRARACACSRCRTGPSSTSGSTSIMEKIPIVPLYFSKQRPVVERDGALIMVDDERMPLHDGERPEHALGALPHARAAIR